MPNTKRQIQKHPSFSLLINHTFIGTSSDGDFIIRVKFTAKERRVRIRKGLLQARASLGRSILIAFHAVQRILCGIQDELWGVVTKEPLAQVHNGLVGGGCGSFVDDAPTIPS